MLASFALSLLLFGAFTVWAYADLGSLPAGFAYLRGERLIVYPTVFRLPEAGSSGEQEFQITIANRTAGNVRLLGFSSSCGCDVIEEFPLDIPQGKNQQLTLVAGGQRVGCSGVLASFFTDCPEKPGFLAHAKRRASEQGACPIDR